MAFGGLIDWLERTRWFYREFLMAQKSLLVDFVKKKEFMSFERLN